MTGTRPSRRTDRPRSFGPVAAVVAGLLLAVFTLTSVWLPAFEWRADVIVSMALCAALLGVIAWGALPLRVMGDELLWIATGGLIVAVAGHLVDVAAVFDPGKIVLGATLGFWLGSKLAELTGDVRWVVGIAVVVAAVDAFSVFSTVGFTHYALTRYPDEVPYFLIALPTMGHSVASGEYFGLGTADMVFFGLYLVSAAVFELRVRLSAAAMAGSIVVTVAMAMWWRAVPALPLLGLSFLLVNADRLWEQVRGARDDRGPDRSAS